MKEATVWIDGLDKIARLRGINFCIDLGRHPYFIGGAGGATNTVFPWVVSDFGLTDAIETGLVKVPQLAVRDTTGRMCRVTSTSGIGFWPKLHAPNAAPSRQPEAGSDPEICRTPIAIRRFVEREATGKPGARTNTRPPVFILVCKNKRIARTLYEWLAKTKPPVGIPPAPI